MERPMPTADQIADHNRDLRKTVDFAPAGADAHTIALLARAHSTSFEDAVDLIASFANSCAQIAICKALDEAHQRTMAILDPNVRERANA